MAYVKKRSAGHLLVAYRPLPGMAEECWRCPDEASFQRFVAYEETHKRTLPGVPIPDPKALFGEAPPSGRGRKPKPERTTDEPAAKTPARCFTLREWLGSPEKLGPYFSHSAAMGEGQRSTYFTVLDRWAAPVASKPMDQVGAHDVNRVRDTMLVCKACVARAEEEGRTDLTARPWTHLLATMPPWDGRRACVDDEGESTHYPRLQSHTIRNYLVILKAAWNVAIDAGSGPRPAERRCMGIADNPFKRCRLPKFDDGPDNNDVMQALTHAQVAQYEAAMPPELACSIPLSVHAMLRREEVLGVNRGSIDWTTFDTDRSAVLRVGQVLRPLEGLGRYGKTDLATREPIYLSSYASERLREHLDRHRSTPDPERCEACAAGHGPHYDPAPNPHRRCPMADDAAVFAMPSTGERPHPDSYSAICVEAGVRAGLTKETIGFKVTHKVLRATGATMLLEAKVEPETVQRMGRWTNVNTLRRHYVRIRDTSRSSAAAALDAQARGELGLAPAGELEPSDENAYLRATVKHLTDKLERYKAALVEHGVDADALDLPPVEPVRLRPPPGQQPARQKRPPSPFEDDDLLRRCVREGHSRSQVLVTLGVTPATKNYRRLEQRATELGLELPPKLRRAS